MDSLTIILTTIILHKLTNALDVTATVCNNDMACKCANNTVSCTTLQQDGVFILPYGTEFVRFNDVPIAIVNNNTFENGKLLREITWVASKIKLVEALYHNDLKYLDLSRNNIFKLSDDTFHNCLRLEYIDLSDNQLNILSDNLFLHTTSLGTVNLEKNHFNSISENLFKHTINLKNLSIGNPNLSLLDKNSMKNLYKLEYLNIQNCGIRNLNQSSFGEHMYLYSVILNNCTHLSTIDNNFISSSPNIKVIELNDCGTIDSLPPNIISLKNLQHLRMSNTQIQPNCQNGWFSQWFNETTTVVGNEKYSNFIESLNEIDCPPNIYYTNSPITLQLTKKGIINCMAYGNPIPSITWLVPGGLTFHENKQADINISHHPNVHNWDLNEIVSQSLLTDKNGSLHILRMLRTHIGNYTCYVSNKYGNSSKLVEVHLDSEVFFSIKMNALLLGVSSALGFLILTILCCAFKLLLIRLNCIKKRSQQTETEMGSTEKPKVFPADV